MGIKGAIATGHAGTTAVAEQVLADGGNAFDAAVAGYFMACVAEPVLASLGGGGFLVAKSKSGHPFALDFFAHTPLVMRPEAELDVEEMLVDFGSATQPFHLGVGTVAVPGCIRGIFEIHRRFCRIPMPELAAPAVSACRNGMAMSPEQAQILQLVKPIYINRASARGLFGSYNGEDVLLEGELYRNPDLADALEVLALEGDDLFYRGEIAQKIEKSATRGGGSITCKDLEHYRVFWRQPLVTDCGGAKIFLNPPPSAGGMLVNFALDLFSPAALQDNAHGVCEYYSLLAKSICLTQQARVEALSRSPVRELEYRHLFRAGNLDRYRLEVSALQKSNRGTTHISIADNQDNVVALTVSNGEGCGEILPQSGIMLNNMLGEDDLNPLGLNKWTPDRRLSSMMCPAIAIRESGIMALGSGGSNRIRTAVLQVLINHELYGLGLEQAVSASRLHFDDRLYLETPGLEEPVLEQLRREYPDLCEFPRHDFYFGGVNAVTTGKTNTRAVSDSRRGGLASLVRD